MNSKRLSKTRIIASRLESDNAMSTNASFGSFITMTSMSQGLEGNNLQIIRNYTSNSPVRQFDHSRQTKLDYGMEKATRILLRNLFALNTIVNRLLDVKSLSGTELRLLLEKTADKAFLQNKTRQGFFRL